ncbi:MAG: hypothetical protein HQL51_00185 [Magnetococcales bacterium]|nr:hypothetical protein [Magnetococcales bacterium]
MPKPVEKIADELNEIMRKHPHSCFTLSWDVFYRLTDRERMKEAFLTELKNRCLAKYGLIFMSSANACFVLLDRNFDPPTLE